MNPGIASELDRIWALMTAGTIDLTTAAWMARGVREAAEAELAARTRHDCLACGAVGSSPAHRPGCRWA